MDGLSRKVLVITPLYNKHKFLPYTIGSVLLQKNVEITQVIVDDCSTDGSYEWVMENLNPYPNIHIIRNEENKGCYQTRNAGLKYAVDNNIEFDYFTIADADDRQDENRYETLISACFESYPDAKMIKTAYTRTNIENLYETFVSEGDGEGSAMFRREIFDNIGYFDNTLRYSGDTEYYKRFLMYYTLQKYKIEDVSKYTSLNQLTAYFNNDNLTRAIPIGNRWPVFEYINSMIEGTKNVEDCFYEYNNKGYNGGFNPSVGTMA